MTIVAAVAGVTLIVVILWEGFETIILPRRVTRRFRFSVNFFWAFWHSWRAVVGAALPKKLQETWLSVYGPLSLLVLLGLWAGGLITGFALLYWASGSSLRGVEGHPGFLADLYLSGTTFFTLGLGDVVPNTPVSRLLTVIESGIGFGFLALILSYLPPLNQSFARREVTVSLLDARAGSPPSAAEILRRHSHDRGTEPLHQLLVEWERWSAELLESHLSYPVLAYFRSQHSNESWLSALTAILDTCAFIMADVETDCRRQAELTFAIARHAIIDLSIVFRKPPRPPADDRLPPEKLAELRAHVAAAGFKLRAGESADRDLEELRRAYEGHVNALALQFHLSLPPWVPAEIRKDNWQATPWGRGRSLPGVGRHGHAEGEHFLS